MFPFASPSQSPLSLLEPLESRRLLSVTVHFGVSRTAAQAVAAHQAHLVHLAHVRHVRHVRHVASVKAQQAAALQGLLTMQPPALPVGFGMTSTLTTPTTPTLTNPVAGALDTITPALAPITSPFNTMSPITSPIDSVTPITNPTPNVSLTPNPFSFDPTTTFADMTMFNP